MAGLNKVQLIGRLGADPEMRYSQSGKAITKMRIATDSGYGDNKRTDWHRVVVFDKTAEACAKYLSKGSMVYVEGRVSYNKWEKEDGTTQWSTEIVARDVQFLDSKGSNQGGSQGAPRNGGGYHGGQGSRQHGRPQGGSQGAPQQGGYGGGFSDDCIPF